MHVFLLLMFEHPEHTKMTFKIKCKVKLDDISYHDNKLAKKVKQTGEINENATNFTNLHKT